MPVHDWTRVDAGIFHDFHTAWITEIRNTLNAGLLPEGYYALAEQHAGRHVADVLTLHAGSESRELPPLPPATGRTAVDEAPPRVRRKQTVEPVARSRRRTLAIRHVSAHRLVALVEILSPANKDGEDSVGEFAAKAASVLGQGVHLLVMDLFPPGHHDPCGIHGVILGRLRGVDQVYDLPADERLTLVAYVAAERVDASIEHVAVGASLPDMPLFIRFDRYVNVPIERTYQAAYRGVPRFWREVLEETAPPH